MSDEKFFDIKDFQKQFNLLVAENKKLTNLKERYVEHGNELVEITKLLREVDNRVTKLAKNIDPLLSVSRRKYARKLKPIKRQIFDLIQGGQQVTVSFIENTFPELEQSQIYNIINSVRNMGNVDTAKDGTKLRLFKRV